MTMPLFRLSFLWALHSNFSGNSQFSSFVRNQYSGLAHFSICNDWKCRMFHNKCSLTRLSMPFIIPKELYPHSLIIYIRSHVTFIYNLESKKKPMFLDPLTKPLASQLCNSNKQQRNNFLGFQAIDLRREWFDSLDF